MKIPTRTLILGIVLVLCLGGLYLYYFGGSQQKPVSSTAPASVSEQDFLNSAAELQPLSFNTAIFSDPRFTSLIDITVPITPETQGRPDPFAPLPGAPTGNSR